MATTTDSLESNLVEYLEFCRTAAKALRHESGLRYTCYEDLILTNGRLFRPTKPADLEYGELGYCYVNAMAYAREHDMLYAEGYAIHDGLPIPLMHAWAVCGDEAIDPTWNDEGESAYFGIAWEPMEALARMQAVGSYGIIANDWLNQNKLLKEGP